MKIDSIGFDLDGTLWDSLDRVTESWRLTAEEYGVPLPDEKAMQSVMGLNKVQLMNKLYPDMDAKTQDSFFVRSTEFLDEIIRKKGGILFDKLEETLAFLSEKYKLYIVSNCQNGYIESFLEFHKLGKYFCDFECSGTKCVPKGENIKLVMNRCGMKDSIFVGDTQGDRDAAKLAGIPFVFAAYGFGSVESYEYKINSFEEMKELVTK